MRVKADFPVLISNLLICFLAQVFASHGPEGGNAGPVIDPINPNILYAGTTIGGVYKSTDGGDSWMFKAFPNRGVGVVIDPVNTNILYACDREIFKSTDAGDSWVQTTFPTCPRPIDPANPSIMYGITSEGALKSTDAGEHWRPIGFQTQNPRYIAIDLNETSTIYVAADRGVHKSTDAGDNWELILEIVISWIVVDPSNSNILYAVQFGRGVHKSIDGGKTWGFYPTDFGITGVVIDPEDTSVLYASTGGGGSLHGIRKSTDGGESWVSSGFDNLPVRLIAIDPSKTSTMYISVLNVGIFKSTDSGENWQWSSRGLTATEIRALAIAPSNTRRIYASIPLGGFSRSTDGGESWTPITLPWGSPSGEIATLAVDPVDPTTVYGGANGAPGLLKSIDGGDSWSTVLEQASSAVVIDPTAPDIVYALVPFGLRGEIYKSLNAGEGWTRIADLPGVTFTMTIDPINTNVLYVGFRQRGVYKSTDGGQTWRSSGLLGFSVVFISIDPSDSRNLYATTDAGIYKSTDGGVNWTALPQAATTILVDPNNGNTLYAGNADGVFKSTDGGHTWEQRNDGLTNTVIRQLAIAPDTGRIYAGTLGGGVWFSDDQAETWQ